MHPGVAKALAAALERLRDRTDLVAELVDVDDKPFRAINATFSAILGWEAWHELGPLVEREPEHLGPETLRLLHGLSSVSREEYRRAVETRVRLAAGCAGAYSGVDALVGPAAPFVPPPTTPAIDDEDWAAAGGFTRAYNLTGAPALVLPCGWADGMPVGLQLSAPVGQDGALLAVAAAVEEALAFERPTAAWVELPAPAPGWSPTASVLAPVDRGEVAG
jgi:Asp-tRNA(Asn)/Glu-tRNA(Gln) amidotransferase A subunit family amidase